MSFVKKYWFIKINVKISIYFGTLLPSVKAKTASLKVGNRKAENRCPGRTDVCVSRRRTSRHGHRMNIVSKRSGGRNARRKRGRGGNRKTPFCPANSYRTGVFFRMVFIFVLFREWDRPYVSDKRRNFHTGYPPFKSLLKRTSRGHLCALHPVPATRTSSC